MHASVRTTTIGVAFCIAMANCAAAQTDMDTLKCRLSSRDHTWMMWATASALSPADRAYLEPELELLIRHYTHLPDANWSNQGVWGGWSGFPDAGWSPNTRREWGISHACGYSPVSRQGTPLALHAPPGAYTSVKVLFPRIVDLFKKGRHGDAIRVIGAASHCIQDSATFPHMQAIHRAGVPNVRRIAIPAYTPRLLARSVDKAADALARETEAMVHHTEKVAVQIREAMAKGDRKRLSDLRVQCCNEAAKVVADFIHTAIALAGPRPMPRPHPFAKNLAVNATVEAADFGEPVPDGWVAWHNDRMDRVGRCDWEGLIQRNTNLWRSGRHSLKLMWAPKAGLEWRQTWPAALLVEPGQHYRASAWLKLVKATGNSGVALQFARRNAQPIATIESKPIDGTSDWVRVAVEGTVPPDAVRLRTILFSRANEGAVWFDDIELVRTKPQTAPAKASRAKPKLEDLVLHFTFDEGKSTHVADHSVYRGVNGPNVCASAGVPTDLHVPDGRSGQAVGFDGIDDFVECPASYIQDVQCPKAAMTLSLWVCATDHRDATLVAKQRTHAGKQARGHRLILRKDGRVAFVTHTAKGDAIATSASPLPLGKWAHVAAVRTADHTLTIYVDGKPGAAVQCPAPPAAGFRRGTSPGLYIGADTGVRAFFAGKLDELQLRRRALSATDIAHQAKP